MAGWSSVGLCRLTSDPTIDLIFEEHYFLRLVDAPFVAPAATVTATMAFIMRPH